MNTDRIAALEAEKAERERQEPVMWQERSAGCAWVQTSKKVVGYYAAKLASFGDWQFRALYAHPLLLRELTDEECERISKVATISMAPQTTFAGIGRAMHRAVVEVMGRRK